jgi:DNA helicase TIP49 (TBP-interacting protein)
MKKDTFKGFVDRIEDSIAYVKFIDESGDVSFAQMDKKDLEQQDIKEGDSFLLSTTNGKIDKLPERELNSEDYAIVDKRLEEAFPDSIL